MNNETKLRCGPEDSCRKRSKSDRREKSPPGYLFALIYLAFLITGCSRDAVETPGVETRWQKIDELHPVDRTRAVQMMIEAENLLPTQTERAALVLSCQQGVTDAYVVWRQYLGAYDLDVTWRTGSSEEVVETWILSTDSEALFSPRPIEFIKQLMIYDDLLLRAVPPGNEPLTLAFDTTGLDREADDLRSACNW